MKKYKKTNYKLSGSRAVMYDAQLLQIINSPDITIEEGVVSGAISGKRVLITGGGGSIGGALALKIAEYSPAKIILLDINENNTYLLYRDIMQIYKNCNICIEIASVRDKARVEYVFLKHKPQVIFHAAAHKHVPLMQVAPSESVKNNLFGTLNMVKAAKKHGAEAFVLISSDKAVNLNNVMGASKRACELIVKNEAGSAKTKFSSVRFGNVFASDGSVIQLFVNQLEQGEQLTLTHDQMERYFISVENAVKLVIYACVLSKGEGEIYMLDMGKPLKMADIAKKMSELYYAKTAIKVPVVCTGIRPGEALKEDCYLKNERVSIAKKGVYLVESNLNLNNLNSELKELKKLTFSSKIDEENIERKLFEIAKSAAID